MRREWVEKTSFCVKKKTKKKKTREKPTNRSSALHGSRTVALAGRQQLSHLLHTLRHAPEPRVQSLFRLVQLHGMQPQTTSLCHTADGSAESTGTTLHIRRVGIELRPQQIAVHSQSGSQRTTRRWRLSRRANRATQTRAARGIRHRHAGLCACVRTRTRARETRHSS